VPIPANARSQPSTNAVPLARARGVTSSRIMAIIASGLIATPTASGSTSSRRRHSGCWRRACRVHA
jgi:hypothetical protein